MKRVILIFWQLLVAFLLLSIATTKAQDTDYRIIFSDAEYYFLYNDFAEALPLYQKKMCIRDRLKTVDIIKDLTRDLDFDLQRDLSSMNRVVDHKSDSVAVIPQPMAVTPDTVEEKTKPIRCV